MNWRRRGDNRASHFIGKRATFVKVVFWQEKIGSLAKLFFSLRCDGST